MCYWFVFRPSLLHFIWSLGYVYILLLSALQVAHVLPTSCLFLVLKVKLFGASKISIMYCNWSLAFQNNYMYCVLVLHVLFEHFYISELMC